MSATFLLAEISPPWQFAIVMVVVGAAALYLGWRTMRTLKGSKPGCGSGCGTCVGQVKDPADANFVSMQTLRSSALKLSDKG